MDTWGVPYDSELSPPRTQHPHSSSPASRRSQIPYSAPAPLPIHQAAPGAEESEKGAKSWLREPKAGRSDTHLEGLREPGNPGARGRPRAQRRAAEGRMARSGSRRPPRRALQGAARSARLGSVRLPARTRSLARSPWLGPPGIGAVRGALSPGICRDPSSGREAAGGEARGRGEGARARLRVSARVSPGWCARQAPEPGTETQGSGLPRPLLPATLGASGP